MFTAESKMRWAEEFKPLQFTVREAKILAEAQPLKGAHYKTSYISVFMLKHGDLFLLQMIKKKPAQILMHTYARVCVLLCVCGCHFFSASKDDQGQSTRSGELNQMQIKT